MLSRLPASHQSSSRSLECLVGLHVLPVPFKESMRGTSIFRRTIRTVSGVYTHPTLPMQYHTANDALKRLGEIAGYQYAIHYYCFRRWVANEANRKSKYIPSIAYIKL